MKYPVENGMSNFEFIYKLLELGVEFAITRKSQDPYEEDWTMYISDNHHLYPDDVGSPCFWYTNDWGLDSIWYCNKDVISVEIFKTRDKIDYLWYKEVK